MSKQKRSELKNVEMRRWWRILSAEGQWWMGMECGRWKEALKALRGEELGPVHVETRLREIAFPSGMSSSLAFIGGPGKEL